MIACLSASLLAGGVPPASAQLPTTPKNAVRSLNHIQDAIARGDPAAFRLQAQMLKLIDQLLIGAETRKPDQAEYRDAVLAYAVSGGNPATFGALYGELTRQADEHQLEIARAVAALLRRRPLADGDTPDPYSVGGMLGAGLALLYGLNASDSAAQADHYRVAALIAPGTLIEESALRRLMPILIEAEDFDEFLGVSSRYARAFVDSPYASDFALSLVEGGTQLEHLDQFSRLADVFSFMPGAHRRSILSRQMRAATIGGNFELVRFLEQQFASDIEAATAPQLADASPDAGDGTGDAVRQRLYALMASITSENHADIAAELAAIDAEDLPTADRKLLAVARSVVADIIRPIPSTAAAAETNGMAGEPVLGTPASTSMADDASTVMADLPQQPTQAGVRSVLPGPAATQPAAPAAGNMSAPLASVANGLARSIDAEDGEHADFLSNARDTLDRLDAVLQETAQ